MLFAYDAETHQWCDASTALRGRIYVCECPERHTVFLRKGPVVRPHFAHFSDAKCKGGGESAEHKAAKHRMRTMKGKYVFVKEHCPRCGEQIIERCDDGRVEIEVRSDDGRWWYDCVYVSNSGRRVALEIFHSHATTCEKIAATRAAGMEIAEFHAEEVNCMGEEGGSLRNLQAVERECERCRQEEARKRAEEERKREEKEQNERHWNQKSEAARQCRRQMRVRRNKWKRTPSQESIDWMHAQRASVLCRIKETED